MSGSSRSAARSASLNDRRAPMHFALVDEALLVLVHELDRILDRDDVVGNASSLMKSTIAASVVLLPEPVGPVTSTSPRGTIEMSLNTWPMPRSSIVSTFDGIVRNTAPAPRF